MTTEFPSNSRLPRSQETERQAEKKVEQVVTNPVESRKKPLGKRILNIFVGGDSKSVVHYVLVDVLVPQVKEMIVEATTQGFERMIYGEARPGHRRSSPSRVGGGAPTNYTRYAVRGNNPLGRAGAADARPVPAQRTQSVDDILFATRVEADTVLDRLYDLLKEYENVSVSDLYSLVGWTSSYTDQKW